MASEKPKKEEPPKKEEQIEEPKVIQDLDEVWPAQKKRGKNRYLFWRNRANSENHGHIFYHEDHNRWNYNIKCNNNKGNDRIRHNISKSNPVRTLKSKIKEDWRKECPDFVKETPVVKKEKTKKNTQKRRYNNKKIKGQTPKKKAF